MLVLLDERVAVTTATTPLGIELEFIPLAIQVNDPDPVAQLRVFPADVKAEPAAPLSDAMSDDEYERVHCSPAGPLVPAFSERFRERRPPFAVDPDARLSEGLWALAELPAHKIAQNIKAWCFASFRSI